nr:MYCBP-associated protein isoform X1 [Columba livia]
MRALHTSAGGTSPPSSACRPCSGSRGRRRISSSRAGCSWTADKNDKVRKQSSKITKEPEPVPCVLQGDDIQVEDLKKDLSGLEVTGKGQPFASVSAEPLPRSTSSEESEILSDTLKEHPDVVPEAVRGPSLVFCGQPARWIDGTTSRRNEVGIAARLTFEALACERAESSLTVSNDGTTAIWYDWLRLPQKIPSRETKWRWLPCFYFDTRSGVILPGETRQFVFIFKSESAGIFSESWEFRTHPLLLGGALLQVTLWGIAVYEDKLADLREKLESDLAARVRAAVVKESLKKSLVRIRTPERTPSPVDACVTEEELFQLKNPKLHYRHRVVQQLHELWRKHMTVPSAFGSKVSLGQTSSVEDLWCQESASGVLSAQSSVTEASGWKSTVLESPSQMTIVEQEERGPSGWNLSIEDFKEAINSIPKEEQREAALAQLNQAVLKLRVPQRPHQSDLTQSDLFYHICLQLWRQTIDGMVSHSMRLRSLLGLPENNTYIDTVPEETVEPRLSIKEGKEDKIMIKKASIGGKDKEAKERKTKAAGKEKEPNRRKLKDEKMQKSSVSSQDKSVEAQCLEALTTKREPSQAQIDPVLFGTYQEKLYIHVYGLLRSMVDKMVSFFEDLETKKVP